MAANLETDGGKGDVDAPEPPTGAIPHPIAIPPEMAALKKRSVTLQGHRTSVSLEEAFWLALKGVAQTDGVSLPQLVSAIDAARPPGTGLSSALRLYVLQRGSADRAE